MDNTIRLRIITPTLTLCDQEASFVTMPGELGEFGVLPGHELLIANLQAGIVKITAANAVIRYFVYNGIAEVNGQYINLLTEFAADLDKVIRGDIEGKLANMRAQLNKEKNDMNIKAIHASMAQLESLMNFLD